MDTGTTYIFPTDAGWHHVMRVHNTLIAFCEGEELLVHNVTEPGPERPNWGPDGAEMTFTFALLGAEEIIGLAVGRVAHPTDTLIAFYEDNWQIGYGWGYVWDVDHPERSYWERSELLADMIDPADVPQGSALRRLIVELSSVSHRTKRAHPRAAAVAVVSSGYVAESVAATLPALRLWFVDFQAALEELAASQAETGQHQSR